MDSNRIIEYKPVWSGSVSSAIGIGGNISKQKKGFLKPGDVLIPKSYDGYVNTKPISAKGTEWGPWSRAFKRQFKAKNPSFNPFLWVGMVTSVSDADYEIQIRPRSSSENGSRGDITFSVEWYNSSACTTRIYNGNPQELQSGKGIYAKVKTLSDTYDAIGHSEFRLMWIPNIGSQTMENTYINAPIGPDYMYANPSTDGQSFEDWVDGTGMYGGQFGTDIGEVHPYQGEPSTAPFGGNTYLFEGLSNEAYFAFNTDNTAPNNVEHEYGESGSSEYYGNGVPIGMCIADENTPTVGNTVVMGFDWDDTEAGNPSIGYDLDYSGTGSYEPAGNDSAQGYFVVVAFDDCSPDEMDGGILYFDTWAHNASNGAGLTIRQSEGTHFPFVPNGYTSGTTWGNVTPSLQFNEEVTLLVGETVAGVAPGTETTQSLTLASSRFTTGTGAGVRPDMSFWNSLDATLTEEEVLTEYYIGGTLDFDGRQPNVRVESDKLGVDAKTRKYTIMNPIRSVTPNMGWQQGNGTEFNFSFTVDEATDYDCYLISPTHLPDGQLLGTETASSTGTVSVTVAQGTFAGYNLVEGDDYYVKVVKDSDESKFARGHYFSIVQSMTGIELTQPSAGSTVRQGEAVTIGWETVSNVDNDGDSPA